MTPDDIRVLIASAQALAREARIMRANNVDPRGRWTDKDIKADALLMEKYAKQLRTMARREK